MTLEEKVSVLIAEQVLKMCNNNSCPENCAAICPIQCPLNPSPYSKMEKVNWPGLGFEKEDIERFWTTIKRIFRKGGLKTLSKVQQNQCSCPQEVKNAVVKINLEV